MMHGRGVIIAGVFLLNASAAFADISRSPLPSARPGSVVLDVREGLARMETGGPPQHTAPVMTVSQFPKARPKDLAIVTPVKTSYRTTGSVCGRRDIRGTQIKAIPAKLKGCGLSDPVRVTEISGIKLSSPATIDCTTAKALRTWIDKGAKKAVGRKGGGLAALKVVASYACRTRNNQPGAKVSEHGRGRAIDVAGLTLKNGQTISVLKGWNDRAQGKILKKMHKSACGPFGTVLGPDANKYHKDHFHFDTARYRSGSYCR